MAGERPVLYAVACGACPAGDLAEFAGFAQGLGWDVCVIATPDALKFLDAGALAGLTGHPVRSEYKQPSEPDVLPPANAMVVAPATFNTINKWARGISDTLALGLLNEALGSGLPIVAAPWPGSALRHHPAFSRSVADLAEWGVRMIYDAGAPVGQSGGPAAFPWDQLRTELARLPRPHRRS
jgi:hypothetical protein